MLKLIVNFYRLRNNHCIVSDKESFLLEKLLLSPSEYMKIIKIENYVFYGLLENKYGSGFNLISNISINKQASKTIISISTTFDTLTKVIHFLSYIILWGICVYDILIIKDDIMNFGFYLKVVFPIISTVIVKLSFNFYDKKVFNFIKKKIE